MKQHLFLLLGSMVLFVCSLAGASLNPAPPLINYQGVLRSPMGAPLSGSFNMIFHLYDAPTGGNEILRDRHTALDSSPVTVSDGVFNVVIGSGDVEDGSGPGTFNDLRTAFQGNSTIYLEVQVELEVLTPRTQVLSAPYALGGPRGVVYTRWGRTSCEPPATRLYHGYPASGWYLQSGNTPNQLCLPATPTWGQTDPTDQFSAEVHGTEYEFAGTFLSALAEQDAVCAVCFQPNADTVFMYPGSTGCPTDSGDWHLEYTGYVVAAFHNNSTKDALCMDGSPETRPGGNANSNGNLWYLTEVRCSGTLPCGPYVDLAELACSVCSH